MRLRFAGSFTNIGLLAGQALCVGILFLKVFVVSFWIHFLFLLVLLGIHWFSYKKIVIPKP